MVQLPIIRFVFDRRKRATARHYGAVELEVYYDRRRKYITTGVRLLPKQWRAGCVTGRADAMELNEVLDKMLRDARRVVSDLLEAGELVLDAVPLELKRRGQAALRARPQKVLTFVEFCEERAEVRKYGKSVDSGKRYDRFLRFFKSWGGIKLFTDISEKSVIAFDRVLVRKGLRDSSKWNNYHRFLNSFIIDAMDEGLLKKNPYKRVRINKDKVSHGLEKHLTPDEFRSLASARMPSAGLERVRDLFVFQTYTCLSYTDLRAFDSGRIVEKDGRCVYSGKRGKTRRDFTFLLLQPALDVLEKYGGVLPIISNVRYNYYLKVVALAAGIDKPLTSHWARHTGATLLLNSGVDMEIVAKILGHSSTRITREVYAKLLNETVVAAMSDFERGGMGGVW